MPGFFESVAAGKQHRQLLAAWMIEGKASGAKALFAPKGEQMTLLCREERFPAEIAQEICNCSPEQDGILEKGDGRVFLERIADARKLVVCGAGHVSLSLIRLCVMLGYQVTVIEDRAEYADKAREAGAHRVICEPFGEALDGIEGDRSTAFVIMTREHSHDVECLRGILDKPCAYAGMMGSRSRAGQVRKQLLEEGRDAGKVEQLHMPIGLKIGSRTPEEIAVSVAAELISVMNAMDPGEVFPDGMTEELAAMERANAPGGVLAMIVEKSGEAPRRPGTKMLVRNDGSFLGTVGGGYAEAVILKTAREMIRGRDRESRLVRVSMRKGTMYCGGEVTVFLTPV